MSGVQGALYLESESPFILHKNAIKVYKFPLQKMSDTFISQFWCLKWWHCRLKYIIILYCKFVTNMDTEF